MLFDYAEIRDASRETYRHMKYECYKAGNSLDGMKFQAKEFEKHLEIIRKDHTKKGERVLLELNCLSNKFGEDWLRGVLFTIVASFILYCLYILSLCCRPHSINDFLKYYFEFFVVTHKLDFMGNEFRPNALSYFLDTFSRIVIGYGIVQTVQAFRKHSKAG